MHGAEQQRGPAAGPGGGRAGSSGTSRGHGAAVVLLRGDREAVPLADGLGARAGAAAGRAGVGRGVRVARNGGVLT